VRVISFDGGWNLPLWAAQRQGYFAGERHRGCRCRTRRARDSWLTSLFDGRNDIAMALVDNVVAYQEGQGEAKIPDNPDLVVFMGADGGYLSVVAEAGHQVVLPISRARRSRWTAMTTGAAFVLRELVSRNGVTDADVKYERAGGTDARYRQLMDGKYAATLLRTPVRGAREEPRLQRPRDGGNAGRVSGHRGTGAALVGARSRATNDRLPEGVQGRHRFRRRSRQTARSSRRCWSRTSAT
jgi:hypothetical protein